MVYLKDVTKSYDGEIILNKVNLSFEEGEVVGLVGENGSGKSTLFRILVGEIKADSGTIESTNESIAYLPQFPETDNVSLLKYLVSASHRSDIKHYEIETILSTLGLDELALNTKMADLSGGEKTKAIITGFLLRRTLPTVLVLDEPTNNLDLAGLEWLENFISSFQGSVILTSHDRFFLDRVTTKIVEIAKGSIKSFGGNYSYYKNQKKIEQEALMRQYTAQQKKIKQVKEDIEDYKNRGLQGELTYTSRNPYQRKKARKAAQTSVVRQKKLEKFLASTDFIEKPILRKKYGVSLKTVVPGAKLIIEASKVSKNFGDHNVLKGVSFEVRGNERLWIAGKNGSGKSTLCKIITSEIDADDGSIRFGTNVKWGYLSQQSLINREYTGYEYLRLLGLDTTTSFTTAAHLHLFEDDLRKKIKLLSYGQIAKLDFVRLLVSNYDLLLLDEPTNHLEIETREDIENALKDYHGALIVVTHDRYFIESLGITHILEL